LEAGNVPELPDITIYIEALRKRVVGQQLRRVRVRSPFLVRTFDPPLDSIEGKMIREVRRLGKRIAFGLEDDLWIVLHLMIAGRLHWKPPDAGLPGKYALAAFDFPNGTLLLTEAGSKHRASLHIVRGEQGLRAHQPGGLDVFSCSAAEFATAMRHENHTLKRTLTDPHVFDAIGNAYSDEILHRARLSPFIQTKKIADEEIARLLDAARNVLREWIERLRDEAGDDFPEKVTAFRPEMAVHGKFGKPCPVCGTKVQRIRYADNETNYCPGCQTGGRILADRSLSRLLRDDWPKHIDDLE
jgi:formamidopyrimidine-DNA glycosylase